MLPKTFYSNHRVPKDMVCLFFKERPNQIVPKGLHIKIDVQTGDKQAKLSVETNSAIELVPGQEAVIVDPPVSKPPLKEARKSNLSARELDSFGDFIKDLGVDKPASLVLPVLQKLEDMVCLLLFYERYITSTTECCLWRLSEGYR
jgi:hypothetical protein